MPRGVDRRSFTASSQGSDCPRLFSVAKLAGFRGAGESASRLVANGRTLLVAVAALTRLSAALATLTTDGRHVLAIAAHSLASLAAGFPRFLGSKLMCGSFGVRSSATLARDLALAIRVHRCKTSIAGIPHGVPPCVIAWADLHPIG